MRGFARVAAAVPNCEVANVSANRESIRRLWQRAHDEHHAIVVFPELGLTGYTARDLFLDHHLLDEALAGLRWLAEDGKDLSPLAIVGLPLRVGNGVYNVAAAIQGGRVLAVVPKSHLPNYREFEERRWFRPGAEVAPGSTVVIGDDSVPFGPDILLQAEGMQKKVLGMQTLFEGMAVGIMDTIRRDSRNELLIFLTPRIVNRQEALVQ